jgi:hypothetical protein
LQLGDPGAADNTSDAVLGCLRPVLEARGYQVETGKRREQMIVRPVFFEEAGRSMKTFNVDAITRPPESVWRWSTDAPNQTTRSTRT